MQGLGAAENAGRGSCPYPFFDAVKGREPFRSPCAPGLGDGRLIRCGAGVPGPFGRDGERGGCEPFAELTSDKRATRA